MKHLTVDLTLQTGLEPAQHHKMRPLISNQPSYQLDITATDLMAFCGAIEELNLKVKTKKVFI